MELKQTTWNKIRPEHSNKLLRTLLGGYLHHQPSVCVLYPTCQWVASLQLTWYVYSLRTSLFSTLSSFFYTIDSVCDILWTGRTSGLAKRSHSVVPCEYLSCSYCMARTVTSMFSLFSRKISVSGITLVALLQAFTIGATCTMSAFSLSLKHLSNRLRLLLVALKRQAFNICFDSLTFGISVAQTIVGVLMVFANFNNIVTETAYNTDTLCNSLRPRMLD